MISLIIVNAGNYAYNIVLGRLLGPEVFADMATLVTLLLILSFIAMTFQLGIAKFTAQLDKTELQDLITQSVKRALSLGILIGTAIILGANYLHIVFNTSTSTMFVIFGAGAPLYFLFTPDIDVPSTIHILQSALLMIMGHF